MFDRNAIIWLIPILAGLIALTAVPAEARICRIIDIKNVLQEFKKLRGCTIVQGNVMISMIEHLGEQEELEQYTFPELRLINSNASP